MERSYGNVASAAFAPSVVMDSVTVLFCSIKTTKQNTSRFVERKKINHQNIKVSKTGRVRERGNAVSHTRTIPRGRAHFQVFQSATVTRTTDPLTPGSFTNVQSTKPFTSGTKLIKKHCYCARRFNKPLIQSLVFEIYAYNNDYYYFY